jgi:hypothetical protein
MAITTAAGVPINYGIYGTTVTGDSDPRTCNYTHFNLSSEQLGRTQRYNCWGFTFLPRRYWIDSDVDVDNIIRDNCVPVTPGSIRPGDVIRYRDDWNITTHTGRVWETDGAGNATLVRSKWGSWAEYLHLPADVPSIYGTHMAFFRQVLPLRGIGDLWIKDSPADSGEQYSPAPWWTSPDILIDAPPYDGLPDANPRFGQANRVWTRISNRGDVAAANVYVRYYWADPSAGLAAASWNLIPGTTGHPNPAGPFSIPANSTIEGTFVEWKPSASPAHQCLLAVAYINDDPKDSGNLDPLVYPFDVPWENSVGQRNVTVVKLKPGKKHKFSIFSSPPWRLKASTTGKIQVVVAHSPRAAILSEPKKPVLLNVKVALEGGKALTLKRLAVTRSLPIFDLPAYRLLGVPVAMSAPQKVVLATKKRRRLVIDLTVPKTATLGSTYYVHIVQRVGRTITGGYTVAVMVD